jgi:hypothetical protein
LFQISKECDRCGETYCGKIIRHSALRFSTIYIRLATYILKNPFRKFIRNIFHLSFKYRFMDSDLVVIQAFLVETDSDVRERIILQIYIYLQYSKHFCVVKHLSTVRYIEISYFHTFRFTNEVSKFLGCTRLAKSLYWTGSGSTPFAEWIQIRKKVVRIRNTAFKFEMLAYNASDSFTFCITTRIICLKYLLF